MGKSELRGRATWQDLSGPKAGDAEKKFFELFSKHFENSNYQIRSKPNEFANIYENVELPKKVLQEIYHPGIKYRHGLYPDYAIDNLESNKTLYIEVKRQDGWVEGKLPKDGRGNAHERSNKFFTPGLLNELREKGNIDSSELPFWVIFQGDIARDPKRVREIHLWYTGVEKHFFMWSENKDPKELIKHFEIYLKPILK
jgi:hypothetical protein